jgi:hypothetical protein
MDSEEVQILGLIWLGSSLVMCKGLTLEMPLTQSEIDYGHCHSQQQLLHWCNVILSEKKQQL